MLPWAGHYLASKFAERFAKLAIFNRLVSPGLSLIISSVSAFGDGADDKRVAVLVGFIY